MTCTAERTEGATREREEIVRELEGYDQRSSILFAIDRIRERGQEKSQPVQHFALNGFADVCAQIEALEKAVNELRARP